MKCASCQNWICNADEKLIQLRSYCSLCYYDLKLSALDEKLSLSKLNIYWKYILGLIGILILDIIFTWVFQTEIIETLNLLLLLVPEGGSFWDYSYDVVGNSLAYSTVIGLSLFFYFLGIHETVRNVQSDSNSHFNILRREQESVLTIYGDPR